VHRGLDLFAESPDVYAPETGLVVAVSDGKSPPFVGYGPGVILLLGKSGYYHLLSHLRFSTITVKPGMMVFEGQKIAEFDPEIRHTHYEVRRQPTGPSETNTVNPLKWLAEQQRPVVAAAPPSTYSPRKMLAAAAITLGFAGASALALRIAKRAATARVGRMQRLPQPTLGS
jgi:hypothetical protein